MYAVNTDIIFFTFIEAMFPHLFVAFSLRLQTSAREIHKVGSLTPPSSPKTAPKGGHRRILSDVTHSAVFGVPVSKSTQLLQAAAAEASLNKSKWAELTHLNDLRDQLPIHGTRRAQQGQ